MNTFYLQHDDDLYEIGYINISILILRRNKRLITFSSCPEEVQEEIVTRMHNRLLGEMDSITNRNHRG